jgi:hypothetical protein
MGEGEPSQGLPLPPNLADCFTEEEWALMSEDQRREMIEIVNQKDDVITDETCRIRRETARKQRAWFRKEIERELLREVLPLLRKGQSEQTQALVMKQFARALNCCRDDSPKDAAAKERREAALPRKSKREQGGAPLALGRAVKCEDDDGCSAACKEATPDAR